MKDMRKTGGPNANEAWATYALHHYALEIMRVMHDLTMQAALVRYKP